MSNKENQRPNLTPPLLSSISPSNKPALSRQRDHSACRRPDTPIKVRKTRENLKQASIYADIPPPCLHANHDHGQGPVHIESPVRPRSPLGSNDGYAQAYQNTLPRNTSQTFANTPPQPTEPIESASKMQRQKSVSRRILSRVKHGISNRPKTSQAIRPAESETSLVRRLSSRRHYSSEIDRRAQSFEIYRNSIDLNVDERPVSIAPSSRHSLTGSTVSTEELFGDVYAASVSQSSTAAPSATEALQFCQGLSTPSHSSPSPQPTPRPPRKTLSPVPANPAADFSIIVPCVELAVRIDRSAVDIHTKEDVWVAMEATIRTETTKTTYEAVVTASDRSVPNVCKFDNDITQRCGYITSLRLCFKPVERCRILDVIGQKSRKGLVVGESCLLFIKLRLPKIYVRDSTINPDQESLFTELESMVGTLEMDILHIEARYRHSMLPLDNVVTVRHVCKMKRPKSDSRWSVLDSKNDIDAGTDIRQRLATYLASQYAPERALDMMQQYLGPEMHGEPRIADIRQSLAAQISVKDSECADDTKPSVVVTDIDLCQDVPKMEQFSTAPSTPATVDSQSHVPPLLAEAGAQCHTPPLPPLASSTTTPSLLSASRTTIAVNTKAHSSSSSYRLPTPEYGDTEDTARQVWRHIRRTSLTAKQLEEMSPETVQRLEADDGSLKQLRQKALANKRSIGAETLKGWKWEENVHGRGEAPWM